MPRSKHYINGRDFYDALVEYKDEVAVAEAADSEKPRIPRYVGECFLKMCTKLATRGNFSQYTYREEMVLDAIENCVNVVDSFDPLKTKAANAFGYFNKIAWNAFIRRIAKEKKQNYTKHKNMQRMLMGHDGSEIKNNELSNAVISDFEDKLAKQEKKQRADIGIEKFTKGDK